MTYEEEVIKGAEAQQLIESPIHKELMAVLEKDLDDATLNVNSIDTELCADIIRHRQVLELYKAKIVEFIQTGKLAETTLLAEETENVTRITR